MREEPAVFAGSLEGQCGKERGAQNDSKDLDLSKGKDGAVVSQDGKDGKSAGLFAELGGKKRIFVNMQVL